ncbi:hypothetical protein [Cryptosporangium sp. NPDC051539]|uniref:hypothetical protein n=1 Tax=Cryptosporangium sp. NPDC051539 TaxID=3363962 RepID=UPI0037B34D03
MIRRSWVAAVVGLLAALGPAAPAAAGPADETIRSNAVVVVGVAGLEWSDVTAERTPTLAKLASRGSVGTLSVRAAPAVTCIGEGWLTLGAGRSAAILDPSDIDSGAGCGPRTAPPVTVTKKGASVVGWDELSEINHNLRFGAQPGLLGTRLNCTGAVGTGGALAAADTSGNVDVYRPTLPDDPGPLLRACPFTAVDLGMLPDAAAHGDRRADALRQVDTALAQIDATRPTNSTLLVVGVADTDATDGRLHVAIADGPGFDGGWLRSPSTGRTPYLQLVDVAPTVLAALNQTVPDDIAGRPVFQSSEHRPQGFDATRTVLVDADTAAVARKHLVGPFLAGFVVVFALVIGLAAAVLRRRPTAGTPRRRWWTAATDRHSADRPRPSAPDPGGHPAPESGPHPTADPDPLPTAAAGPHPAAASDRHPAATDRLPAAASDLHPAAAADRHPAAADRLPAAASDLHPAATDRHPAATDRHPASGTDRLPAAGTDRLPAAGTDRHPAAVSGHHPAGGSLRGWLSVAVTALGAFPVATFLANLVPWWRADPPAPALAATILGALAIVTAIAIAPPWGRTASGRMAAVSAITVLVLLADVMTGARLQLNSLLGYTALEAGRFVGFGNVAFAVLGASALLLAAALATGRPPRSAVAVALAVAVPVIVVEGSPGWGTDFGGILTLVPAFGVLALLVAGRKVTTGKAAAVLGAGAGLVAMLATADYLRPEEDRTHFGRFVATVLDGDGLATVDRKVRANLDLLFAGPHTITAAVLLVIAAAGVFRPPAGLRAAYVAHPGLRTGLRVVVVLGLVGFAVNDSGIAIPLNAALVALPAAVAAWLRPAPSVKFGSDPSPDGRTDPDGAVAGVEHKNGQGTPGSNQVTTAGETDGGKPADTPARSAEATADVLP